MVWSSTLEKFINAVIDEKAFDKISGYIDRAKESKEEKLLQEELTIRVQVISLPLPVLLAKEPDYITMCEEIFADLNDLCLW